MRGGLLGLLEQYDAEREAEIRLLLEENARLKKEASELRSLLDASQANVEAYKLRWIFSMPDGCKKDPLEKHRKKGKVTNG